MRSFILIGTVCIFKVEGEIMTLGEKLKSILYSPLIHLGTFNHFRYTTSSGGSIHEKAISVPNTNQEGFLAEVLSEAVGKEVVGNGDEFK
ncbi:hypothetical protein [Paenibacillus sp. FSL L8-0709]|uniref:hypothetical protein n=1 Tax=Paenibacillus sp. FSL L8-0709 TaxID=2975312 RepID=UPI0030F7F2E8